MNTPKLDDRTPIMVRLKPEKQRKFKSFCALKGMTQQDVMEEAIDKMIDGRLEIK